MNATHTTTLVKISLALTLTQALCLPAHGQDTHFPSDGSANSFLSKLPQAQKNSAKQTENLAISYVNYMKDTLRLTPAQAAGVVGNLMYASGGAEGLNSGWQQKNEGGAIGLASLAGDVANQSGYGIAQWQASRKQNLINFARQGNLPCANNNEATLPGAPNEANLPTSSQAVNFGFLMHELGCVPAYANVIPALRKETTLLGAVCVIEKQYEQPLKDGATAQRMKFASMVAKWTGMPQSGSQPAEAECPKTGGGGGGTGNGQPGPGQVNLGQPYAGPPGVNLGGTTDGDFTNNANGYGQLKKYERFIVAASTATGVPVDLIAAVIWDESSGNANVGCTPQPGSVNVWNCGLMQLRSPPNSLVATDPETNIMHGTLFLANNYKEVTQKYGTPATIRSKYGVSAWDLALRVYNSGWVDPNNIDNGFLATSEYVRNIHKFAKQLHTTGHLAW